MTRNGHYQHGDARYGFKFGAAWITRLTHAEGRYHVVAVDTPDHHLQIAVSPTGRSVRVWKDGVELGRPVGRATPSVIDD